MVITKSPQQIELMQAAARILVACHRELRKMVRPGVTTLQLDQFVEEFIKSHGAIAEQKGYHGFPFTICASVDDEICHGFPNAVPLRKGNIVTIDIVVNLNGWLADSAWSYPVGSISKEAQKLLDVTKECLYRGIAQAIPDNRLGDVAHAIQSYAESQGFSVVRDFTGHGIGREMHEDPQVLHFGNPGTGIKLREGMVFTIEPMINAGTHKLTVDRNGWTARTLDGGLSAQYEHTIAVTKDGPLVLTEQD